MADSARYALHRPEVLDALERGEHKIIEAFADPPVRLAAGTTLVSGGEDHRFVYRLQSGWLGRHRLLPDGRNQFILFFLPGDLFAVKSMFMRKHPDDIRVLSDAVLQRIPQAELLAAFNRDPDIATRCIWQVMEEERRLHSWVVGLGQGSAEERAARALLDFRARLVLSRTIAAGTMTYPMPLTQSQLADFLGITSVHVSRVLKDLRSRDLVSCEAGAVSILNLEQLATLAAPLLDPAEEVRSAYVGRLATPQPDAT
ncbi:MAG TPA: Crp/Fnr family transcriptional regulator [Steroidobacteraceae bacterium]|nr:Crp/Fnr family transcriptional regulator [Steroidobacteraceae bacterium]